ncbi:hypothetical protein, partial [Desulfoplanes sp.]
MNYENSSPMMEILKDAFPGRSDEQIVPIGLIYAGVRWGKDNRYGEVPIDKSGKPINVCRSEESYWSYLEWLCNYLYTLDSAPNEEQQGLCKYLQNMLPEDGIQLVGMNAALYQLETEPMESWIEENEPFAHYSQNVKKYILDEDEEYDEEADRILYERVKDELNEQSKYCPDVQHADVSYRVPLSITLKK